MDNLLIFGGTFDPVHQGHIKAALAVQNTFQFNHFIFLPCKVPVLKKSAHASMEQRLAMLNIAIEEYAELAFEIDSRELKRDSPSYMVTTLEDFRREYGTKVSISLMIGTDAYNELPQWHRWEALLELTNLLVINRPRYPLSLPLLEKHIITNKALLKTTANGLILPFDAGHYDFSSTSIRHHISHEQPFDKNLYPKVADYIKTNHLYGFEPHQNQGKRI